MPIDACANDNWIGRERVHVREASLGTKMLASLGRCCWKQVRLGRHGDPSIQEKALTGNTIFFADAKLLSDNLTWVLEWCLKGGYMLVDPRTKSIKGSWRAWGCMPGSLELERTGELQLEPTAPAPSEVSRAAKRDE